MEDGAVVRETAAIMARKQAGAQACIFLTGPVHCRTEMGRAWPTDLPCRRRLLPLPGKARGGNNFTDFAIADCRPPTATSEASRQAIPRETRRRRRKMKSFKKEFTLEERANEAAAMIANYPGRIPVVVERFSRSNLPEMEKRKYLVPCEMPVGQFIFILRSRLHLSPGTALFVFVNNTLPQTASLMGSVYDSYKDEKDGFLYMCYSSEKTFG